MGGEVGDGSHAKRLRAILPHRQRIRIVEAQWYPSAQSQRLQRAVQSVEVERLRAFQDFALDGPGVFRIDVDLAVLQRGVDDAGIAEAGPVHRLRVASA